jgi:hypothetical protein
MDQTGGFAASSWLVRQVVNMQELLQACTPLEDTDLNPGEHV